MTQVAKFNATQVAVFGKIEVAENDAEPLTATDVLIMTGVTYDPNIPTSSEALVGDFLSRDSVVNITDTFGDFSGDSYVPVLNDLLGSVIASNTSILPISRYLECCNLNADETAEKGLPQNIKTRIELVKSTFNAASNSLSAAINQANTAYVGLNDLTSTDLGTTTTLNTQKGNLATFKVTTLPAIVTHITGILDTYAYDNITATFFTDLVTSDSSAIDNLKSAVSPITVNTSVAGLVTTISTIITALAAITVRVNGKVAVLNALRDLKSKITTFTTSYDTAVASVNAASVGLDAIVTALTTTLLETTALKSIKFTNSLASKSSLTIQVRKSSLDIADQKVVTLTGVRGTVDLNVKIAERPKFKFNFHGNIANITNEAAFSTNINAQKTNIAPVTLNSNISNAAISPMNGETYSNNISFISFSASNFDGFDLKRTQTGGGDFWYPQGIAHDVTITILEDTAREDYTGSTTTLISDATSFRPEDNVGKEFKFMFEQGTAVGNRFSIYMDKLTLKGYKHTTQGNVASIDLTFEASGISELTLS